MSEIDRDDKGAAMLFLQADNQKLFNSAGVFDPWNWAWMPAATDPETNADLVPVTPVNALVWLFRQPNARRVPVAVIGPKQATPTQLSTARELGRRLGELRVPMITGGKTGVMEAASRGCLEAGGQPIGILPDDEWQGANEFVAIPIATGLGSARNAIIARAAFALVAIGGEYGTLSEMAFGLHFSRLVLAMEGAPEVRGAQRPANLDEALECIAQRVFRLAAS